jgi:hypothetical protein
MKGKGKLITKAGALAVFMEDVGEGEYFRIAFVEEDGNIFASTELTIPDVVWVTKCLDNCVETISSRNVQENWYGDSCEARRDEE